MAHTTETFGTNLGSRGRLVIPASLRERVGWKEGDRMILIVDEENNVRLVSSADVARQTRGMFAHIAPGVSLVDELIADRRAEAAAEEAEAQEYEAARRREAVRE